MKTLSHYDELIIPHMFGFKDGLEYYQKISCDGRLNKINVPTLILSSRDDFVFEVSEELIEEIKINENLVLALTKQGGHVCHLEGTFIPS